MLNKIPLLHQSLGPCVCLSFCLSVPLPLSLRLILWSVETCCAHSLAQASKTLSRRRTVPSLPREGAQCLHEWLKLCVKSFIGFLHKTRNISLFLSLFYFLIVDSRPPGSGPLKDLNKEGTFSSLTLPQHFREMLPALVKWWWWLLPTQTVSAPRIRGTSCSFWTEHEEDAPDPIVSPSTRVTNDFLLTSPEEWVRLKLTKTFIFSL